jgi:hypothetical protein
LLRELATVANDTLAFLYGGADQQPGDYERNQCRAPEIRAEFTAFCEQHPHYANWRQAWAAFRAQPNAERKIIPLTFDSGWQQPIPVMPPATAALHPGQTSAPLWQQRARRRATFRRET